MGKHEDYDDLTGPHSVRIRKLLNRKYKARIAGLLGVDSSAYKIGDLESMIRKGITPLAKGNYKGGLQTKNYVNPITVTDNRKNK